MVEQWEDVEMDVENTAHIEFITPDFSGAAKILRQYKNRHAGRRCFVIGNGPSLKAADLDKIKEQGYFSIASNRIYFIFDQTDWRPNVYTTLDPQCIEASISEISALKAELKIIPVNMAGDGKTYPIDGALPIKCHFNTNNWIMKGDLPPFSDDVTDCVYNGQSITYINLQIAVYLGFREIILIGVDHQYKRHHHIHRSDDIRSSDIKENTEIKAEGTLSIQQNVQQNHFCADYWNGIYGTNDGTYAVEEVTLAYKAAKEYAEAHGIKILNATRGGKLNVFKRVNFDSLFAKG